MGHLDRPGPGGPQLWLRNASGLIWTGPRTILFSERVLGQPFPLRQTSASSPSPATDNEEAIANPDLRMAFDTFKKRRAENSIVVVDVRSEGAFLAGHDPGALTERTAELRARGKPVATYCS